jgi:hypothetical protein
MARSADGVTLGMALAPRATDPDTVALTFDGLAPDEPYVLETSSQVVAVTPDRAGRATAQLTLCGWTRAALRPLRVSASRTRPRDRPDTAPALLIPDEPVKEDPAP